MIAKEMSAILTPYLSMTVIDTFETRSATNG